ncbi:hypothetical protein [Arenibacter lacus]|uniref:hypothetical protein n=1 Tax=Arenibacter lacus TaxID=2608629 RepID=UPI00123DD6DF|nr:hypothetical protein [Arenibacter lacus]
MSKEERYFNFPIQLLEGFMQDSHTVLNNIFDYAIYTHTLRYTHDNEINVQVSSACKFFGVTAGNAIKSYHNGEMLYSSIEPNSPMVGINKDMFFDYYKDDKNEFHKVCLLGFLALRSIIQDKRYIKITNNYLWARMDGKAKSIKSIDELSAEIRKYANNYQTRKIKEALSNDWYLRTYSYYTRGFYVSFKLSMEELVLIAETNRASYKNKKRKQEEKEAREKAIKQLSAPP